jgi:UDP-N-acetylmuramoyl-tripeptide--D-alanyl-D-alanine ligase
MPSFFSVPTLCEILKVPPLPDLASSGIQGITTDTRSLRAGEVFVALRGETFDGHAFIEQAVEKGALAVVVDFKAEVNASQFPVIRVPDTLVAYQAIAQWWRQQFHNPVIAITGSVGKTTTKELLAGVLSHFGSVHKSQANYNNEIGVPKTLLQIVPNHHDFAIIEMGMRGLGEIALLSQIAQPDIGVITNVGTAHIGWGQKPRSRKPNVSYWQKCPWEASPS